MINFVNTCSILGVYFGRNNWVKQGSISLLRPSFYWFMRLQQANLRCIWFGTTYYLQHQPGMESLGSSEPLQYLMNTFFGEYLDETEAQKSVLAHFQCFLRLQQANLRYFLGWYNLYLTVSACQGHLGVILTVAVPK